MVKPWMAISLIFVLLIVLLQISLWHGPLGVVAVHQLNNKIKSLQEENQVLQERNQKLYDQIQALKNNAQATEAAARENLGFVKPGEIFYRYEH